MYSYEDRIRAIELYIKLGKRVRAWGTLSLARLAIEDR